MTLYYGVANRNFAFGLNYDLDITFIFKVRPLRWCVNIGVIDDNILILVFPHVTKLFRCDREGKENPLVFHILDSEITAMTVLDKNHLLPGFKNGEVSLYFLPFLPSLPSLPSFTAFPYRGDPWLQVSLQIQPDFHQNQRILLQIISEQPLFNSRVNELVINNHPTFKNIMKQTASEKNKLL